MLVIGSHVSFGSEQILGSLKEALSYNANTFMFYTGAPTNTIRKDIDENKTNEALKLMEEKGIDINNVVCHAPYIVNLGNNSDPEKYKFSIDFIRNELKRCDLMGITKMVLHPGNATGGLSKEEAINNIINAINEVLDGTTKCVILVETMAGKGSECGSTIDEIASIVNGIHKQDQIGICLDTCHLNDGGYDMNEFDSYLDELGKKVSLDKIGCIHVNDSKNELGSHKDRHANIGKGTIGFNTLCNVIYNERLKDIPKILETPYIGDSEDDKERLYPPYKYEIEMLRNKKFEEDYFNKIWDEYKHN